MTSGLADRLTEFTQALREHGIQSGPGETVDAAAAVRVLGTANRERMREGLAAALIRRDGQRAVFDQVFDVYFPLGVGAPHSARVRPDSVREQYAQREELRDQLVDALAADDRAALTEVAGDVVDALGFVGAGEGGSNFSAHQALESLQPQTLLVRVLAAIRAGGSGAPQVLTDELQRQEIRGQIEQFRERVRTEARRRVAEDKGRERVSRHAIQPPVDRADFLSGTWAQLGELRRTVRPLARILATRLATRRKRASRGQINLRSTLRRSLGTGGVPIRPVYRNRRPARPELVLLCDVSGSVAGFAQFTMLLVQALHDQFSKLRVFAFVDAIDEVTDLVSDSSADPEDLGERIMSSAAVATWDGRSDYRRAFGQFADSYLDALGPRTSVFILGDARNNGGDPNLAALEEIAERARRVYWLNPESKSSWGLGDSVADRYAELVPMYECRTAQQLSALVSRLLPV